MKDYNRHEKESPAGLITLTGFSDIRDKISDIILEIKNDIHRGIKDETISSHKVIYIYGMIYTEDNFYVDVAISCNLNGYECECLEYNPKEHMDLSAFDNAEIVIMYGDFLMAESLKQLLRGTNLIWISTDGIYHKFLWKEKRVALKQYEREHLYCITSRRLAARPLPEHFSLDDEIYEIMKRFFVDAIDAKEIKDALLAGKNVYKGLILK
jgi:hypothetical protein